MKVLAGLAATAVGLLAPSSAGALDKASLARVLDREQRKLGSASAAMVVDLGTGQTLYASRAERRLIPASNEKLFVTATALLRFGPAARLTTVVAASPDATLDEDGRLDGDLYLVGAGDPTIGDSTLTALANQVRRAGVRRVTGGIFGDESAFDTRRGGPRTGYAYDSDIGGSLGALVWARGTTHRGSPALAAVRRFGQRMKAAGVRYSRAPRVGSFPRSAKGGGTQAQGTALAQVRSPAISELARSVNVHSDNFGAEMLAKTIGAKFGSAGSTGGGLAVARRTLGPFSIAPVLADGSGLSRTNRASALELTTLLAGMRKSSVAEQFRASLPVAGLSGTIARRMRGTAAAGRCRAKTGTLSGVSSLSGYCTSRGGRAVAFSLIENGVNTYSAKAIEDRMAAAIARLD